jgi:hypothetical protein
VGGKRVTFTAEDGSISRICYDCKEEKTIDSFPGKEYRCSDCNNKRNRLRDKEYRDRLRKIKLERGCADCGYNAHAAALHFDHLPEFEKIFELGQAQRYSWKKVEEEMTKCEIVCANCHAIRTAYRKLPDTSMLVSIDGENWSVLDGW